MFYKNFVSLQKSELDKKIYRIISLERFEEILNKKVNTLINPSCWKDKFENLSLTADIGISDISSLKIENRLGKSIYCQCWSLEEESANMWEVYSKDDYSSVKVSTTIGKLFNSLYDEYGESYDTFIGRVLYAKENIVRNYIKENSIIWIQDKTGLGIAKSLLIKRDIFSYEKEIRLIYNSFGRIENNYIQYGINPNYLFDEVVLDSRLNNEQFEINKKSILDLGWKNSIKKSIIYDYPEDFIL